MQKPAKPQKKTLTQKQKIFVREYLKDFCASRAARDAGYSLKSAHRCGVENMQKPAVQAAIREKLDKRAAKIDLSAEKILSDIIRIAQKAEEQDNLAVALKSRELIAKHAGLFIERKEISGPGGGPVLIAGRFELAADLKAMVDIVVSRSSEIIENSSKSNQIEANRSNLKVMKA